MTTSSSFGENVDRLGSIRSILDNYPFSAGLLREILQNSDDAKASKQIFLLDRRRHPSQRICDPSIAETQGPALLAFNDAPFLPEDWVALQTISRSSKREDTSKIGKFGIGIRSCYHITDFLQILSGKDFVIFDPQCSFNVGGGSRFTFSPQTIEPIRDHLQTFEHFLPSNWNGERFDGTVVRLPLRTKPGEIREKTVSPEEIGHLFQEFIEKELSIAMLFLHHLKSIEFLVIDEEGTVNEIARCTVEAAGQSPEGLNKLVVRVQSEKEADVKVEEWLVVLQSSRKDDVLKLLSEHIGIPSDNVLRKHKLRAEVGLAFPLNSTHSIEIDSGQLFTFLRLPIRTGFPAHIHSLFSLTPSRQNLRPHGENGIVKGSDDDILIEWNKLLFDVFIPRTWAHLLESLTTHFPTTDIFSAWPVAKHFTESDSAYWASFPMNVLDTVLSRGAVIWPIVGRSGVYEKLQNLFVASPTTNDEVLQALASAGMSICHPPEHLFRMIEKLRNWNHRVLTPERASTELRDKFASNLLHIPAEQRATILQYLLSSNNIRNIVGLAIVPTVSGAFAALRVAAAGGGQIHILLETPDVELFRPCDSNAVSIGDLPPSAARLFRQQAPRILNVKWLDAEQVVRYLSLHPTRYELDLSQTEADGQALTFLSAFWTWLGNWANRWDLLQRLGSEYVLPCAGGLKRALRTQPVFDATSIDPALAVCLSRFQVPFLLNGLSSNAKKVLEQHGFLKSANEIHALLDAMGGISSVGPLSEGDARLLLKHFNQKMVKSMAHTFNEAQKTNFRTLPIFPIVEYGGATAVSRRWAAVNGLAVYGVSSFELLPELANTVFVDLTVVDKRLLPMLNDSRSLPMSDMDVLELSITRLSQQSKAHLARMLRHVVNRSSSLTSSLKEFLSSEKYAYSAAGTREAPRTLIDPSCPLRPLYANDRQRLHSEQDEHERSIADSLARLELLDNALSTDNITDRIRHIAASNANSEDAKTLLNIIYQHGFNCHSLTLAKSAKWLPTQKGTLVSATECRPGKGTTSEELHLFDRVLELVHSDALISPSLRTVLGWDNPIPVETLLKQFRDVLENREDDVYHRVKNIIKEFSRRDRDLTPEHWSSLCSLLENRKWVPTSEYTLVESWQAVFLSSFPGIYTVAPDLCKKASKNRKFLMRLNCLTVPSFDTVTRRLSQLAAEPSSEAVTASAVAALKFAVSQGMSDEQRSQLLVPDDTHRLCPIQDVLFNDVGANSLLLPRDEVCLANSSIDYTLAMGLRLQRLGLKHIHLQTLGADMGVTPATIVEKTLAQYTDKQFLPEFLANAHDAGASKLLIILNNYSSVQGNFLSPALEELHNGPSVMVYNDSEFTDGDFEGICKTHIGGKVGNPDSIGQFGLGALTMFHITECAVIYSGEKVLFLDPSKSYLPIAGRASLLMPLKDLDQLYPGHSCYLKGLEFFDPDARRVNGTIFFLPLRSSLSTVDNKKPFVPTVYSTEEFRHTVLQDFRGKAGECMLFIKVNQIEARMRVSAQCSSSLWSLTARRTENAFGEFIETRIRIDSDSPYLQTTSSEWLTMSNSFEADTVPQEFSVDGSKKLKVGLAAPLSDTYRAHSKFFSMLPLAIPTSLPVHVNASFRMSSDRRQIRLDSYDNDETKFNRWLLKKQIPPLYLALLERIAQEHDNSRWWPGTPAEVSPLDEDEDNITTAHEDALTSILTDSFYSSDMLPKSPRRIFNSKYSGESLKFSEAVLYSSLIPSPARRVVDLLRPKSVIKLAALVRSRLASKKVGLTRINSGFVSQLLRTNDGAQRVRNELDDNKLTALLVWLGEDKCINLQGLPLLQLENRTWARFETGGSVYYTSPQSSAYAMDDFFPPDRLVRCGTLPGDLLKTLSNSGIKVAELNATGVGRLVEEKLKTLNSLTKASWVDRFWKMFPTLPQDGLLKSIERLPLVPTLTGASFKSLTECKESGLFTDTIDPEWLIECFRDLGIDVIPLNRFPSALRDVLRSREYSIQATQFNRFLRCLSPIIGSAVRTLKSWPFDPLDSYNRNRRNRFSDWVRGKITTKVTEEYVRTVRQLPVWLSRKGMDFSLCSANEVVLLPQGISVNAGRFCRNFVTADSGVAHLGITRQNLTQLYTSLDLPHMLLSGEDEEVYKNLLTYLLNLSPRDSPRIQVPNASRVMVYSDNLFERAPFFEAAFGSSDHFLLPSFDSLAARLYARGLKRESDLDLGLFSMCARAFQDECDSALQVDGVLDQERLARAETIYQTYCETLPLHVASNQAHLWYTLGNIRFIPRDITERRRFRSQEIHLPEAIRSLPRLVSPNQVVRTKFLSISWTQRVALERQPLDRLLVAFPEFGKPSVAEVVAHLKALAELSAGLPHASVVLPDLKATYKWLNEQETPFLVSLASVLQDSSIFLNVDDPNFDVWKWTNARQMAFETHDVGHVEGVREFLAPYSNLLKAAGVLKAFYPELEVARDASLPDERDLLKQYRDGFSELRAARQLVDVRFSPEEEDSSPVITDACLPFLSAHRTFLSVCNTHFKDRFTGGFADRPSASDDGLLEISLPASSFAIKTALDFLYAGQTFGEQSMEIELEDLLQALELSGYLQIDGLFLLAQREVVERRMVDPLNFTDVRNRARQVNADILTRWCDEYEARNLDYIRITSAEGDSTPLN